MTTRPRRVDALLAQALESSGARARGGVGKNQSTGMQVLLRVRLMFAKSAIPGLRVILGLSHPMRRLAWTAALAALVCIGLNDLYVVFREYFEYADTVDVKWARSPEGMALPAVTFCNLNQVRKNVFCGDIELNRSTATEWQQRICGGNSILPIWLRENDAAQRDEFQKWITELQRRNETTAKFLGHQWEDMVKSCLVNGKDCKTPEHLQVNVYGRYGNCFCLGCNLSAEREKIQTAYSPNQGVRLLLDLEIHQYMSHSTEAGFVVNVHQPGVQVDFRDSIFLLPRHTTMISVTQSIYFRLEPPYRNPCQRDFPEKYRDHISLDRVYTRKACRHICAQLYVIAACGCQSHDYDTVDRSLAEICNEDDEELNNCIADVAEKIDGGQVECPCLESCTVVEYSWQASSLKWTKNILEEQAGYERNEGRPKELTEVVVYLASAQGYRRKNDPKVTVPRLVSSMGSIMGMQFQRAQECRATLQGMPWNPHHHLPGYKLFSNWRGIAPYLNKAAGHH
ncbi:degenerin-like protein unc-105 [Dermacentor variabilis]|uniref:degenerin-like protein unc-105 n=1 Tax=Dermacentor variabilis TaxID=34621 RepID=UPI003F5B7289